MKLFLESNVFNHAERKLSSIFVVDVNDLGDLFRLVIVKQKRNQGARKVGVF